MNLTSFIKQEHFKLLIVLKMSGVTGHRLSVQITQSNTNFNDFICLDQVFDNS